MKPFLLIQSRPEVDTSENEYQAFLDFGNLNPTQLVRRRCDQDSLAGINLDDYSGIFIGGGPFNMSDPADKKSDVQKRVEAELFALLDQIIERDFPVLATCYGIGLVSAHQGGRVSHRYGEQLDAVTITLNERGSKDPLLNGLPEKFSAFVGHKEACEVLPDTAQLLASSIWCPVQMYKIKTNIYVSQFHPELDSKGLETRIRAYKHHGYFPPEEADELIAMGYKKEVNEPQKIVANFVKLYARTESYAVPV